MFFYDIIVLRGDYMESRNVMINLNRSGSGSISHKLLIPAPWAKDMGIDSDNKDMLITYDPDSKTILIKKADD